MSVVKMKSIHTSLRILLLCLLFGNLSCEKATEEDVFEAKLLDSFCAFNIISIENPAFYSLGMKWKNSQGTTLEHVFSVANPCDFNVSGVKKGETFRCRIIKEPRSNSCAVCMGFMETPPLQYHIEVVR